MSLIRSVMGPRRALILQASSSSSLFTCPVSQSPLPIQAFQKAVQPNNLHSQRRLITQHRPMEYAAPSSSSSSNGNERLPASPDSLIISEASRKRLNEILDDGTFLRISVESGGCSGFQYKFEIEDKKLEEDDVILTIEGKEDRTMVVIDKTSLNILKGSTLDHSTELIRSGFKIVDIPLAENGCSCGSSFTVKID